MSCVSQTNFGYSGHGQNSAQVGFLSSPAASSSSHASQWSLPEADDAWFVSQQSPSTSTQYSASPLVPPSLSRDSSISPSSTYDAATDVYPAVLDTDGCGSETFDFSVYVQDHTKQFSPDGFNRYMSNNSNYMSMHASQNQKSMMTSDVDALGHDSFESMTGVDALAGSSQSIPGSTVIAEPKLEVHCPRPHRPYVPKWQIDPNVDLDQYALPRNPHPTPCEPASRVSQPPLMFQNETAPANPVIIMDDDDVYAMADGSDEESEDDEELLVNDMECEEDDIEYEDGDAHYDERGAYSPYAHQGMVYAVDHGALTAFSAAGHAYSAYQPPIQHPTRGPVPSMASGTLPSNSLLFQSVSDSVILGALST